MVNFTVGLIIIIIILQKKKKNTKAKELNDILSLESLIKCFNKCVIQRLSAISNKPDNKETILTYETAETSVKVLT